MMKKKIVKTESEMKRWFMKNYKKLGYSAIVRKDIGKCPDFIMKRAEKIVQVELETKASNFLLHKHDLDKVDEVVCIEKDKKLEKPVISVDELKFVGNPNVKVTLSIDDKVYSRFQKFCYEKGYMLSRQLEIAMQKCLEENKRGKK